MIIKHKNMRDVAAQVFSKQARNVYRVCWINLLGTYENPKPFPLVMETVQIDRPSDWESFKTVEEAAEKRFDD